VGNFDDMGFQVSNINKISAFVPREIKKAFVRGSHNES
jgi:hypothetical protein